MQEPLQPGRSEFVTLQGRGTSPGLSCGPLRRNRPGTRPDEVAGAVLVAERAVPDDLSRIVVSAGTVTVGGAILSHVSLLSRELGKPSVNLSGGRHTWIAPDGGAVLLEIADEESDDPFCSVEEGDIVLLDGDRGTLRIPGGLDRGSRISLRGLHRALLAFACRPERGPALDEIAAAASDSMGPEVPFLLEAGLVHRLVPEGTPARLLLDVLSAGGARRALLEPRIDLLRARIVAAAAGRHAKALEAIAACSDPDEVERILGGLEAAIRRARSLLLDLETDPDEVGRLLDHARRESASRLDEMKVRIHRDVREAAALSDAQFSERAATLYALVRRARSAGVADAELDPVRLRLDSRFASDRDGSGPPLVVALDGVPAFDRALVGGKAAGLLEVRHLLPPGCRVPQGFVLTSAAYRLHVRGEIGDTLRAILREGDDDERISRRARAAILSGEVPAEVARAVSSASAALLAQRLAVRSSSTVEDGPAGSLAGLFDTFLGVRGVAELLNRIRWAWASLWNARALRTLCAAGISPIDAGQAVLVQEMIETRAAGVLVSRDAARGADTLLVNAAWGLGEGISQGGISGDLFWVRRSTGELLASEVGSGARRVVLDPAGTGTIEQMLAPDQAGKLCLDGGQVARLAALARSLEKAGRVIREAEFGFSPDGTLVLFQVRPGSQRAAPATSSEERS